jgi:hypothetical protein
LVQANQNLNDSCGRGEAWRVQSVYLRRIAKKIINIDDTLANDPSFETRTLFATEVPHTCSKLISSFFVAQASSFASHGRF